jgi:phospholipase C
MIRFIEDNWLGGQRIGQGSFDGVANSIDSMFTFVLSSTCYRTVILDDQTGEVTQKGCAH